MAASGTVTLLTESVDYPDYSRGDVTLTNVIGWSVNNNGVISFSSISSSDNAGGTWGICGVAEWYGVTLEAQVSYNNGGTWNTIASAFQAVALCPTTTNTISTSISLINSLGTAQLTGDCQLRMLYYANAAPAPTYDLPVAFPDSGYSAAVQVPVSVPVELDYRPGTIYDSLWKSHNRTGGTCHLYNGTKFLEMKTQGAPTEKGNPPAIYHNSAWFNQRKLGKE